MDRPETNRENGAPELTVEKLVYGGRGLGRLDGRAVLLPFVLPGETVRIAVEREKPGLIEARLDRVAVSAPERVPPLCLYFGRCGGCHYQHAGYEFQLAQKVGILREVCQRVGKLELPAEIRVIAGPPWEYRNRVQFHFDRSNIGFREAGSSRLCRVERCPVASPRINEALAILCEMARDRRFPHFVRSMELFTNGNETQVNILETARPVAKAFFEWLARAVPGADSAVIDYPAANYVFRVNHRSFFQVNRFLVEELVETAIECAEGDTAIDLYAGVGLFSLPLARRFRSVTAVESGSAAVRDLEFNAARAALAVDACRSTVDLFLERLEKAPDFVLADPPRAGLEKSVVRSLARLRPRLLTIVSCDPATLARDLSPLLAAGYRIDQMTFIDLFPETYHIETVTRLRFG